MTKNLPPRTSLTVKSPTFYGLVRRRGLSDEQGTLALVGFTRLTITRFPADWLRPRMWALRHNLSAYDATYVALPEMWSHLLVDHGRPPRERTWHRMRHPTAVTRQRGSVHDAIGQRTSAGMRILCRDRSFVRHQGRARGCVHCSRGALARVWLL